MKKYIVGFLIFVLVGGCQVQKSVYDTKKGKVKQNYYNGIQFNNKELKKKYQKRYDKQRKKK